MSSPSSPSVSVVSSATVVPAREVAPIERSTPSPASIKHTPATQHTQSPTQAETQPIPPLTHAPFPWPYRSLDEPPHLSMASRSASNASPTPSQPQKRLKLGPRALVSYADLDEERSPAAGEPEPKHDPEVEEWRRRKYGQRIQTSFAGGNHSDRAAKEEQEEGEDGKSDGGGKDKGSQEDAFMAYLSTSAWE